MDTGSTGIVVSAEHFIPGPRDVSQGPGRLVYNSSGRILTGEHWLTDVVIRRDEHTPVATARVQVLRVNRIACLEHARDCRPESEPRNVGFMGAAGGHVGYGWNGRVSHEYGGVTPGSYGPRE